MVNIRTTIEQLRYQQWLLALDISKGHCSVTLSRRALFQKTGAVVAALGLAELAIERGIPEQAEAYGQLLTRPSGQSGGRKLALLIGIDSYPKGVMSGRRSGPMQLQGCATDVTLQRELLIHRFGFLPADIVCLTNEQATRAGIYEAFVDHLYNQAQSGDVVVLHFSGYGSKVRFAESVDDLAADDDEGRSLVPFNGFLPTTNDVAINDISEIELKSLLKQLKTRQVTTVIDAGFVDIPVPLSGGLRSRYRPEVAVGVRPSPFPLIADGRLATASDPFPGTLLRGGSVEETVMERPWDGFSAGVFTYVLTQYLWSAPDPLSAELALGRSRETLIRWGGSNQQPSGAGSSTNLKKNAPIYNAALLEDTRGNGFVQSVGREGKKVTLWLGGLPPRVLKYLGAQSLFSCGDRLLRIQSHNGLTAEARLEETAENAGQSPPSGIQVGASVLESVRVLPKNITLIVALDSRLERIERVDATSALSALAFVNSTSGTDLPADCLLGKPVAKPMGTLVASNKLVTVEQGRTEQEKTLGTPDETGYGLFSLTRSLIPGTLAQQEEAIHPAVDRLTPKLRTLLALKLLRLSENRVSSKLLVRVTLERVAPEETLLMSRQTIQSVVSLKGQSRSNKNNEAGLLPQVPIGTRVRYRLFNEDERPLYYTLFIVNPRERISAFCPTIEDQDSETIGESSKGIEQSAIAPGSSVAIPNPGLDWAVDSAAGPVETYVICSTQPLKRTFEQLLSTDPGGSGQRISPLPEPLAVIESLLADISQQNTTDEYRMNVASWATLNFTYEAV